jgi:hypothetical protein
MPIYFASSCNTQRREDFMNTASTTWEPKRRYAARWSVSVRTIDRWRRDGLLDPDAFRCVNGRDYIRSDAIPAGGKAKRSALVPDRAADSVAT